jgi:hypothetical protein
MTAAAGTIGTSWMSTAAGPPELDSKKFSNSREDSNIQQGHLQQQQELTTRISATAAETIESSQLSTSERKPARAGVLDKTEMPTTVLTSAGTPTAQYGPQLLISLRKVV